MDRPAAAPGLFSQSQLLTLLDPGFTREGQDSYPALAAGYREL